MYIGADDNGNIVGLGNKAGDLLDKLPGKIKDTLGIVTEVKLESQDNLEYITIKIDKYPIPISYHGKFYLRSGRSNHEATASEYDRLLLERFGKTWDAMQVPNATVEDLDKDSIERFKKLAVENKRLKQEDVDIDNESLLKNLKLYENGYLTTAAILLFHNDPEKWIPGAYTRIGFFGKDDADLKYQDEIHGSLIYQAEKIVEMLYTKYLKAYVSFNGMQRIDEYIIPEVAAREIIYNFLQHKAYNIAVPTQIKVYDDHLYIWNPGEIPNEVKDILFKAHPSIPRNLKISQTFFRAGFVEYWGSGIKRITDACKDYGSPIPEIVNEAGGVAVKCSPSESYLKAMNGEDETTFAQTSPKLRPNFAQTNNKNIEDSIIELIQQNNKITQNEMAENLNVSRDVIKRNIKKLKDSKKITREGNRNSGIWRIL
jgi:ATP-dependent DNA helicase RecG